MTSQLCIFKARSILWAFVVPELKLLFTAEDWSAQPYSITFDSNPYAIGLTDTYQTIMSQVKILHSQKEIIKTL